MNISKPQRFKLFIVFLNFFLLTAVAISSASAQAPFAGLFNQNQSQQKKQLPEYTPQKPGPKIVLPPPPAPEKDRLSTIGFVYVKKYRFNGNTIVSDKELDNIAGPFTNRKISIQELHELRYKITLHYINKGYINSGAVLPDQKVENGVITFKIIEGRLTDLEIIGTKRIKKGYVLKRIDPGREKILNINELQKNLQLLHQNPLISKINVELSPGLMPVEAFLKVAVTESNPFKLSVKYANDYTPASGSLGLGIFIQYLNLSGWGDSISGRYEHTKGADEYSINYTIPINSKGTMIALTHNNTDSQIIEEPFDLIDITSEARNFGISLSHPIIKNPVQELLFTISGEKRNTKTYLFGQSYSFVGNTNTGQIDITIGRLSTDWTIFRPTQVFAIRSVISSGFDILDATSFTMEPDGEFVSWLGQLQWSKRLDIVKGDQMILKYSFQISDNALPSMERFSVGGRNTVRGYREAQLVRDNGQVASIEYRFPIFRLPLLSVSKDLKDGMVQLAPFFDWGKSWNKQGPLKSEVIYSAGAGIRWDPSKNLHAQIYFGKGLKNIENASHDLQNSGIHFLLQWDLF